MFQKAGLKDYRIKGHDRLKTMTLDAAEFICRFLLHVLPSATRASARWGRCFGLAMRLGMGALGRRLGGEQLTGALDVAGSNRAGKQAVVGGCGGSRGPDDRPAASPTRAAR